MAGLIRNYYIISVLFVISRIAIAAIVFTCKIFLYISSWCQRLILPFHSTSLSFYEGCVFFLKDSVVPPILLGNHKKSICKGVQNGDLVQAQVIHLFRIQHMTNIKHKTEIRNQLESQQRNQHFANSK